MKGAVAYVLLNGTDYEGTDPIAVFMDKEKAEALKREAEEYDGLQPCCGSVDDDDSEAWDKYDSEYTKWRDSHVCGKGFFGADYYAIKEVPLHN